MKTMKLGKKAACSHILLATIALTMLLFFAGCTEQSSRDVPSGQKGVSDVLQEQTQASSSQQDGDGTMQPGDAGAMSATTYSDADVSVDLTKMGADMVYATVYDMMCYPDTYQGKVVRMDGTFYHTHEDAHDADYFFVVIKDATACCAQGLEFVWGDGSHAYPDDYPADDSQVVVTGVFEKYSEGPMNYVRLSNADMQLA